MDCLLKFLDYEFQDQELLRRALTHRSAHSPHNERLEFLGDAVLGMVVADYLFTHYPNADEGQLTRTRAQLVNRDSLALVARQLDLGQHLVLGEGELKSGGWRRDSILANAFESILGAIYLDGGIEACRQVVVTALSAMLAEADPARAHKDAKTALQEYLQGRRRELPNYEMLEITGPSHDQIFTVRCHSDALEQPVIAQGPSRRKAEQAAAEAALRQLLE